jgi:hypothetical protein
MGMSDDKREPLDEVVIKRARYLEVQATGSVPALESISQEFLDKAKNELAQEWGNRRWQDNPWKGPEITKEQEDISKASRKAFEATVAINSRESGSPVSDEELAAVFGDVHHTAQEDADIEREEKEAKALEDAKWMAEAQRQLDQEAKQGFKPMTAEDLRKITQEALLERNKTVTARQEGLHADSDKALPQPTHEEDAELKIAMAESATQSPELQTILRSLDEKDEKLQKAKEAREEAKTIVSSLQTTDLYLAYNHLFSPATKLAYKNLVTNQVPQRKLSVLSTLKTAVFDRVLYFGVIAVGEDKIFEASKRLASVINSLSKMDYVTGALCRMGMIKLATEPHELPRYAIFSFPSVTQESVRKIKDMEHVSPYIVTEGAVPGVEVR